MQKRRRILMSQLPIPPAGLQPIRGNVPLAAGYLKLFARRRGLENAYDIDILPTPMANNLSDLGLVEEILSREPWMVGFSCYLWNIERTLWLAEQIKRLEPQTLVLLGGPEITADNRWVLDHPAVDFAALGEGEQTFVELLDAFQSVLSKVDAITGLYVAAKHRKSGGLNILGNSDFPKPRKELQDLDSISSPYLDGILDAAEERMLMLETVRGCIFKCKFCYYPKSYNDLHFMSIDQVKANLDHAREKLVSEVVLLDPTLNQRKDFKDFLRLLADCNPNHAFTYFGELRGEGIFPEHAKLLRAANFTEVEIGLQSVDPHAQDLMDRKNNIKAFEKGARAMLDAGLKVKVDLIIGLPGDTAESVRKGIAYLRDAGLHSDIQVFNLAILPGTAFREEATMLGLRHQPRPPYYVLQTPTLTLSAMYDLMEEAMEAFDTEFDPLPPPVLADESLVPISTKPGQSLIRRIDFYLDATIGELPLPEPRKCCQALCLWFTSADLSNHMPRIAEVLERHLAACPFSTLQVVLEPSANPQELHGGDIESLTQTCLKHPSYLDRLHGLQGGRPNGAKRMVVVVNPQLLEETDEEWLAEIEELATLMVRSNENGFEPLTLGVGERIVA